MELRNLPPPPLAKRSARRVLLAALLIASGVGAYHFGTPRENNARSIEPQADQVIDGLAVPVAALDFGEVWESKGFVWELPVRNPTEADISIPSFATSCGCSSVEPRSVTVPAGQSVPVRITLDLTNRGPAEVGKGRRTFRLELTPNHPGARRRSEGWIISGTVRSRVTVDTLFLAFGEEVVSGQGPVIRKVIATAHVPVDRLEATCDPSVVSARVTRLPGVGDRFEIAVTPSGNLPPGPFDSQIQIDAVSPDGERFAGVTLPVAGVVQPEVRAVPAQLLLGVKPVGQTAEATVVLQGKAVPEIVQIEVDSTDTQVEAVAPADGQAGRAFRVTQRVAKPGDQTSVVRFVIRKSNGETQTLPMNVRYHGQADAPGLGSNEG